MKVWGVWWEDLLLLGVTQSPRSEDLFASAGFCFTIRITKFTYHPIWPSSDSNTYFSYFCIINDNVSEVQWKMHDRQRKAGATWQVASAQCLFMLLQPAAAGSGLLHRGVSVCFLHLLLREWEKAGESCMYSLTKKATALLLNHLSTDRGLVMFAHFSYILSFTSNCFPWLFPVFPFPSYALCYNEITRSFVVAWIVPYADLMSLRHLAAMLIRCVTSAFGCEPSSWCAVGRVLEA
jgi:hypothetical protein